MRRLLAALAFLCFVSAAAAQSSKSDLSVQIDQSIFPNTTGQVTPKAANTLFHAILNAMCGLAQASDCPLPSNTFIIGQMVAGNVPVASTDGFHIQDSGMRALKSFIDARAPNNFDDSTKGYLVGSPGINTTAPGVQYTLLSEASPGNAVWAITSTPALAVYVGTVAPTVNQDNSQGFAVGSTGVNTANGDRYTARDVTAGAAVWALSGSPSPNYVASNWYLARGHEAIVVNLTPVGSTTTMTMTPFIVTETMTIGSAGSKIRIGGSSTYRMGIYASSSVTNLPTGTALATTGDLSDLVSGATGGALGANLRLNPGMYWEAIEVNDTAVTFVAPFTAIIAAQIGAPAQLSLTGGSGVNTASCATTPTPAYGQFNDLTGATFTYQANGGTCGILMFQVVSVP